MNLQTQIEELYACQTKDYGEKHFRGFDELKAALNEGCRPGRGNIPRTARFLLILLLLPCSARGQTDRVGIIDFYGLRKVSEDRVRQVLKIKEGDGIPASRADVEARLETIPGVERARLNTVCCEAGMSILYVGIQEKEAPRLEFRSPPRWNVTLPREIVETDEAFGEALEKAVRSGDAADDLTEGHSLMANPACRALQMRFVTYAASYFETLRNVLRNSADGKQRAIAAWVLGYASKKRLVVTDLEYAMLDPDEEVRNNAMRALAAFAVLAARKPEQQIKISPDPFVDMLNSLAWTDRNKASFALAELTESRAPGLLISLRKRALPSLVEMARWKSQGHAMAAYMMLGRLAGLSEKEIEDAWHSGSRETVIARAIESSGNTH